MNAKRLSIQEIEVDRQSRAGDDSRRLEHFGYKVFSQSDEDGIIEEIFKRIGTTNKVFVEFGVEIGEENNTRYLLEQGWTGLWIESFPSFAEAIRYGFRAEIASGQLKFIEEKVTAENINDLIKSAGITGEIDLLSIDIDSNDYYVYEAISVVNPRFLCIEHNSSYPPPEPYIMPYNPDYRWNYQDTSTGASIKSLEELANRKGMVLVGCGLYSPNGFYVRKDLVNSDLFSEPFSCERFFNPLDVDKIFGFPRDELRFQQVSADKSQAISQASQAIDGITSTTPETEFPSLQMSLTQEIQDQQSNLEQDEVQRLKIRVQELQERLKKLKVKYSESEAELQAIKNSKFWELRAQWVKVKGFLGLLKTD